ncbi:MAG: hypothetical protein ACK4MV_08015 [Beijerinckiaceae bacterium]
MSREGREESSRRWFLTFADGNFHYRYAAGRLARHAKESGLFTIVECYNFIRFKKQHNSVWRRHKEFLLNPANRRGAGYWLWKPLLIHETLARMSENDVLLWCDAGCVLNPANSRTILDIWPESDKHEAVFFEGEVDSTTRWLVCEWTNSRTIKALNLSKAELSRPQISATVIILRNTPAVRQTVRRWISYCTRGGYTLLVDNSDGNENDRFKEHRHDQALLSIAVFREQMGSRLNVKILPAHLIERSKDFFVFALRNRSGNPVHNGDLLAKLSTPKWVIWKLRSVVLKMCMIDRFYFLRLRL